MFIIAPAIKIVNVMGILIDRFKITNHFGINPVNGGMPPKDRSINGISTCKRGDKEFSLLNWVLFCWLMLFRMMNKGAIIKQYIR